MSKVKRPKKLRRPNVPLGEMPLAAGGGAEISAFENPATGRAEPVFDYSHIRKDLTRIGLLAGGFIALLVALSFFLK